ncbi:ATP-dependent protease La (LON) substrate-binding domain [Ceratobasidium sp. AG-Ba]|nr:ATP-dependent protease La (LON) substrate-binding domain [Ceratobasidium sp. AG-Ba]
MPAPPVPPTTPPEHSPTRPATPAQTDGADSAGSGAPRASDGPGDTRSIHSPPGVCPTALDRGSVPAPSASPESHIPPRRALPPLHQPTMPASDPPLQSAPPAPLRPSTLLPLLRCSFCRLLLEAPTTLNCGHTVCSKHMTPVADPPSHARHPATSTTLPARPPTSGPAPTHSPATSAPPNQPHHPHSLACPVEGCRPRQPARVQVLGRTGDPDPHGGVRRGVTFSPADHPSPAEAAPGSRHPLRGPVVRLDVTISKLLELVTTATRTQTASAAGSTAQHLSDSESDEDEAQPTQNRYLRPARSPATDRGQSGIPSAVRIPPRPSKRQRTVAPVQTATGLPDRSPAAPAFEKELLSELTCEICYMLLYNPITTPCQHTFCNMCLERSLDHSPQCPLCRLDLPPNSYFYQHAHNQVIVQIVAKAFPELLQERMAVAENDGRDSRLDTAIFVCQLSYPGMPTLLHFFEPRYRLMLRRCLSSPTPRFGMVMPRQSANNTEGNDYGTMLEIKSVQMLSDGRSMVETFGTFRFRILERGTLDGYLVGRIERIDDYPPEVEAEIERNAMSNPADSDLSLRVVERSNQELVNICRQFIDQLRNGTAPWVVQRLNNTYGPMPTDISSFSFWVALVLPIDEQEKAKLLPIRSARLRLRLVVHWIEQLNNNWWFSSGVFGLLQDMGDSSTISPLII